MNQRLLRELVVLTAIVLSLAGFRSLLAVGAVQVAQTDPTSVTITTTTTQSTTITATMTTTSIQYSLTTNITTSTTTHGTQVTWTSSTTRIIITEMTTTSITNTPSPPTLTATTTSTQFTQVLGNALGELIVSLVSVTMIVIVAAPRLVRALRRDVICGECGYRNPPFVKSFCTKCGKALSKRRNR